MNNNAMKDFSWEKKLRCSSGKNIGLEDSIKTSTRIKDSLGKNRGLKDFSGEGSLEMNHWLKCSSG